MCLNIFHIIQTLIKIDNYEKFIRFLKIQT